MAPKTVIAWTIAGSDSGGGAGVQADLLTFNALGVHGCTAITAVTAQNSVHVDAFEGVSHALLQSQLNALWFDLPPKAIKTGMLPDVESVMITARMIEKAQVSYICDPVMVATSGDVLMSDDVRHAMIQHLFPKVDLLTPNTSEASFLIGGPVNTPEEMRQAATQICAMGCRAVLIKGGHMTSQMAQDFYADGTQSFWIQSPRLSTTHTHGSGCTLSAAITAACALGYPLPDAVVIGKAFVNQGLRLSRATGAGHGCLAKPGWPSDAADAPWVTLEAEHDRESFPPCGQLGFYPIVDRASWLKRLFSWGVKTAQIRIKDLKGEDLERELVASIHLAKQAGAKLFINDYWRMAIEHDAYGVHLGQEDLDVADLKAIQSAKLRLGISTHTPFELARAQAHRPSYIAIGPVYETTLKKMPFAPHGSDGLRRWRNWVQGPVVAIAGITLERAPEVLRSGADSIAVVSAITQSPDPERDAKRWLQLFEEVSAT
ncbi:MAG: bifunctional hydroxymethylpyrimidine kinase/phosphomethylpyrimidine kinase [Acidobacteria bacterium]|nr:bifunctional hydroxymethylpyrimidine kinase/phosphomethylpyrimidine kinase [Acidobacteriota bacterium]